MIFVVAPHSHLFLTPVALTWNLAWHTIQPTATTPLTNKQWTKLFYSILLHMHCTKDDREEINKFLTRSAPLIRSFISVMLLLLLRLTSLMMMIMLLMITMLLWLLMLHCYCCWRWWRRRGAWRRWRGWDYCWCIIIIVIIVAVALLEWQPVFECLCICITTTTTVMPINATQHKQATHSFMQMTHTHSEQQTWTTSCFHAPTVLCLAIRTTSALTDHCDTLPLHPIPAHCNHISFHFIQSTHIMSCCSIALHTFHCIHTAAHWWVDEHMQTQTSGTTPFICIEALHSFHFIALHT